MHDYIHTELVRLKQAEFLAAADASRLTAGAVGPKNRLWHRLACLTRLAVLHRRVCAEMSAPVT